MSERLEDGIWEFDYGGDERGSLYVIGDEAASILRDGELICPAVLSQVPWKPLRRIADLDGKPVVDEGVVEAMAKEMCGVYYAKTTYSAHWFAAILRKHLCPTKQEASGEGEAVEELKQYKQLYAHALECVDLVFQTRSNGPKPILPNFLCLGECKFKGVERLAKAYIKLLDAISAAGFQVMRTSGNWSLHDVGEFAKREEERTNEVIAKNLDLEIERDRLQARIAELEATPTTNRYRETATGGVWVFLPEDDTCGHYGLRLRDGKTTWQHRDSLAALFTAITPIDDAPIVRLPGLFDCWTKGGRHRIGLKRRHGDYLVIVPDGADSGVYGEKEFSEIFTRTRPITLSPEQEATLAKLSPIISDMGEARRLLGV